jgi:hypothetical protein
MIAAGHVELVGPASASFVLLGKMMTEIYRPHQYKPGYPQPVYEIDSIDIDRELKVGDWLNKYSVVRKDRSPGYIVGTLEEARINFTEKRDITGAWGVAP